MQSKTYRGDGTCVPDQKNLGIKIVFHLLYPFFVAENHGYRIGYDLCSVFQALTGFFTFYRRGKFSGVDSDVSLYQLKRRMEGRTLEAYVSYIGRTEEFPRGLR